MPKTLRVQSLEIPFWVSVRKKEKKPKKHTKKISEFYIKMIHFPNVYPFHMRLYGPMSIPFKFYEFIFSTLHGAKR